ncbi:diguanylate cyclase [Desulforamulus profundi]|uniref:Diguanylate cyclase n=1 Tax=Desulforamulus profundi TaxID=1383067 RepID=A0A2C6LLT0_9FIRM|nr:NifB/NifX family molybdenum-iron cluster-binding protein [Desulforamulus profundi]PHJ39550.1 diguanylate cyclase [Desulforamulus profundi]
MIVAVSAFGNTLDSKVNPRLGKCEYFVLYHTQTGTYRAIDNTGRFSSGAAGVATTGLLNDHEVTAVITGTVGPNAFTALEACGIKVYTGASGKVEDVLDKFLNGQFAEAKGPTPPQKK